MNAQHRKMIAKAESKIGEVKDSLQEVLDAEQKRYDSMSEKAKDGDKGQTAQTMIDTLESVIGSLENAEPELAGLQSE